jgi:transcriptional regulator with XRE-family HTH domain
MSINLGAPDDEEPVGAVLARMRRRKRITGAKLAAMVGMSQPKISRIERGKGVTDPRDIGTIARALGADETLAQALMERAEQSHDQMTDWRTTSIGLVIQQKTLADWESAATVVRDFQPSLVPGLLQISGYAKTVLQSFQHVAHLDPDESALLAAVTTRLKRQEALADQSRSFQFVLGEATLKRRINSPVEMLAQIDHIRDVARHNDNVTIAVVPDGAPTGIPVMHGFSLLDDRLVVVDLYNTGLISRSRRDVQSYRRVFDALSEQATDIEPFLDMYRALYIEMLRAPRDPQP